MKNKAGQATVEYLVLIVLIAVIFGKVIKHVQDIFYGWGNQQGAVELFIQHNIVDKLSNPKFDNNGDETGLGWS